MSNQEISDKNLHCAACGDGFVFSAGEQELFRLRGIDLQPQHCPTCTRAHLLSGARRAGTELSSA
jgi:hypothetical protein